MITNKKLPIDIKTIWYGYDLLIESLMRNGRNECVCGYIGRHRKDKPKKKRSIFEYRNIYSKENPIHDEYIFIDLDFGY